MNRRSFPVLGSGVYSTSYTIGPAPQRCAGEKQSIFPLLTSHILATARPASCADSYASGHPDLLRNSPPGGARQLATVARAYSGSRRGPARLTLAHLLRAAQSKIFFCSPPPLRSGETPIGVDTPYYGPWGNIWQKQGEEPAARTSKCRWWTRCGKNTLLQGGGSGISHL